MSTKSEYRKYIGSEHWQQRRKRYLLEWHHCRNCRMPRWVAILVYDNDLHVHHVSYENVGQEEDRDLRALCKRCHEIETFGRSDLVAPTSHLCKVCMEVSFNPWRELCDVCEYIKSGFISEVQLSMPEYLTGEPAWELILFEIASSVGIDKVLDSLGGLQEHVDRVRRG